MAESPVVFVTNLVAVRARLTSAAAVLLRRRRRVDEGRGRIVGRARHGGVHAVAAAGDRGRRGRRAVVVVRRRPLVGILRVVH